MDADDWVGNGVRQNRPSPTDRSKPSLLWLLVEDHERSKL